MTMALLLGTSILVLVLYLAASAFCLQLGSRWMMIPNVTFGRALWATLAVGLVELVLAAPLGWIHLPGWQWAILALVVEIVLSLGLTWLVIAWILKTSVFRAFVVWLPTLIPAVFLGGVLGIVGRLCLFEAFKTPQNAMAPAILGRHCEAPCPRCGSPAYCTPEDERRPASHNPVLMICSKDRRTCTIVDPPRTEYGGDRYIVNKVLHPRRWDVVIFRWPEDPKILFCMRLVGLPGETVTIRDGAVWIDGKKQTLPESCRGIEYLDRMGNWPTAFWGSETKPAKLGPDEYFVLGDFSAMSKDSRLWEKGAPGHPPYAVPAANIVGVVTHIYWPPERARALR
jgi:signal peptidase I